MSVLPNSDQRVCVSFLFHSKLIADATLRIDCLLGAKTFLLAMNWVFFLVFLFKSGYEHVWLLVKTNVTHSERVFSHTETFFSTFEALG